MRADLTSREYKREEYDILSYFGDIGGLSGCVTLLGTFLASPFVSRLFKAALVSSTYRL